MPDDILIHDGPGVLKHYRAIRVSVKLDGFTLMAASEQEAQQKIMADKAQRSKEHTSELEPFLVYLQDRENLKDNLPSLEDVVTTINQGLGLLAQMRRAQMEAQRRANAAPSNNGAPPGA